MSAIHLLNYDIPEVHYTNPRTGKSYTRSVMPNPSARLWRAGAARLTLSCWLIHEGGIPYSLISDFKANGVKYQSAPFDPSAAESLTAMALESIRKEMREYLEGAKETRMAEDARLSVIEESETEKNSAESEKAHKRYRRQLGAVLRRVRDCFARVKIAAEKFGISPEKLDMPDSLTSLEGIKASMERRAEAFAKATTIIVKTFGKKDAMAKAIANDDVFGPIAADYLEDIGTKEATASARELRSSFGW